MVAAINFAQALKLVDNGGILRLLNAAPSTKSYRLAAFHTSTNINYRLTSPLVTCSKCPAIKHQLNSIALKLTDT